MVTCFFESANILNYSLNQFIYEMDNKNEMSYNNIKFILLNS